MQRLDHQAMLSLELPPIVAQQIRQDATWDVGAVDLQRRNAQPWARLVEQCLHDQLLRVRRFSARSSTQGWPPLATRSAAAKK